MFLNSNLQNERVEMRHILYVALVKITQLTVLLQLDLVMTNIYSKYYQHSFFFFFPGQSCVIPCGMKWVWNPCWISKAG